VQKKCQAQGLLACSMALQQQSSIACRATESIDNIQLAMIYLSINLQRQLTHTQERAKALLIQIVERILLRRDAMSCLCDAKLILYTGA
jgi:hypothetical protein